MNAAVVGSGVVNGPSFEVDCVTSEKRFRCICVGILFPYFMHVVRPVLMGGNAPFT